MKKTAFYLSLLFLTFAVVFKVWGIREIVTEINKMRRLGYDNINVDFLHTLTMCFKNLKSFWSLTNLFGNTVPFFIFGVISRVAWSKYTPSAVSFLLFSLFVFFEIIQYLFRLGTCDIDDVFLNALFAFLGVYFLDFITLLKKH